MEGIGRFSREVGAALAVIGGFVALALGAAALEATTRPDYPRVPVADSGEAEAPTTWLVDGFNLLHAAVLRGGPRNEWWREANRAQVLELAARFDDPRAEVVVVFDGARTAAEPTAAGNPGPRVVFAASADEWMLAALRAVPDPGRVAVVTADRSLAARARHRGAQVVRPTEFAARCRSG